MKPDITLAQARAAATVAANGLARQYPETNKDVRFLVIPEPKARPDPAAASFLPSASAVLMALALLVLLAASANIAGLQLARIGARGREMALRMALGSSPAQLMRLVLAESLVLAVGAGSLAFLLCWAGGHMAATLRLPTDLPIRFHVDPDWRVLVFTIAASGVAGIGSALAPAVQGSRLGLRLARGGERVTSDGRGRLRSSLVLGQVAVCTLLLVCGSLLLLSLRNAGQLDLGFRTDHLLLASVDPALNGYSGIQSAQFCDRLLERIRVLSGVRSASAARYVPFGFESGFADISVNRADVLAGGNAASVRMNIVDTDYFRTAGVRLLIGREFSAEDTQNKPHVAIVNDALARSFWPRDQALGRKFYFRGDSRAEAVVIGVARNTQWLVLGETGKPMLFLPSSQRAVTPRTLYIYTTVRPELLIPAMKREVARLDREVMPYDIKTMDTHIYEGQALLAARTAAALAWIFGLMALALSATGVYGLISHSIGLRLREMGIRRALGASRWHVLREAGGRGLMLAVTGVTLGLGMAAASLRLLRAVLYEIGGETPWVFVGCGVLLLLCGFTAVYLSSRRAFRPELATVLRCE